MSENRSRGPVQADGRTSNRRQQLGIVCLSILCGFVGAMCHKAYLARQLAAKVARAEESGDPSEARRLAMSLYGTEFDESGREIMHALAMTQYHDAINSGDFEGAFRCGVEAASTGVDVSGAYIHIARIFMAKDPATSLFFLESAHTENPASLKAEHYKLAKQMGVQLGSRGDLVGAVRAHKLWLTGNSGTKWETLSLADRTELIAKWSGTPEEEWTRRYASSGELRGLLGP